MTRRRIIQFDGPDPIDVHVGSRIRSLRQSLRLSQTTLGNKLGITFQQIQKYENGANRVSASALYRIAYLFDVGVGYFFDQMPKEIALGATLVDENQKTFADVVERLRNSKRLVQTVVALENLPSEVQAKLLVLIRAIGRAEKNKK